MPFTYATGGYLAHGYTMTIHRAQGATADRTLLCADDTISGQVRSGSRAALLLAGSLSGMRIASMVRSRRCFFH